MNQEKLKIVGHALYKMNVLKERKRYWVFLSRAYLHRQQMTGLFDFLEANSLRKECLAGTPSFIEQATRAFFYKGSTYDERISLIEGHLAYMESKCQPLLLQKLYAAGQRVTLWEEEFEEKPLTFDLWFHGGQRKEGCLSLVLQWGDLELYQIMFWFGKSLVDEEPAVWIGALQGTPNGGEVIKALTKRFFGYRTKNLIFYGIRNIAKEFGCSRIYAVSNDGYYAMNHIRADRKLKTSFGDFWEECEGTQCEDKRFYVLPIEEYRKDMSELKTSKRAQHRKRFEAMDKITEDIHVSLQKFLK